MDGKPHLPKKCSRHSSVCISYALQPQPVTALPSPPHHLICTGLESSWQSHTLHLNLHPLRQLLDGHTTPRRLRIPKVQFILLVHFREILHVRQEYRHLHHLVQVTTSLFQDLVNVFDTERSFVGHRSRRQSTICQSGELARDVDCVRSTDGLGVRPRNWMGRQFQLAFKSGV